MGITIINRSIVSLNSWIPRHDQIMGFVLTCLQKEKMLKTLMLRFGCLFWGHCWSIVTESEQRAHHPHISDPVPLAAIHAPADRSLEHVGRAVLSFFHTSLLQATGTNYFSFISPKTLIPELDWCFIADSDLAFLFLSFSCRLNLG